MSIASTTNRNTYTGNGSVSSYDYTYRIFEGTDLLVTVKDTDDVETTLTITTDYTVDGVGDLSGGSIQLVDSGQAWLDGDGDLLTGYIITIRRVVPITQETDIRNQGEFFPEIHEDQFDRSIMIAQQQQDEIDRSMKLSETTDPADFDTALPAALVGAVSTAVVTNSTGDGFAVGPTTTEISNAEGYAIAADASATAAAASAVAADTSSDLAADWATKTSADVDGSEYSSKEYAVGIQRRGVSNGGSSKDWATYMGGTVDAVEYSAKYYAGLAYTYITSILGNANSWTGINSFDNIIEILQAVDSSTTGTGASLAITKSFTVVSNASLVSINNITTAANGRFLILKNSTGVTITLVNDSGGTAANRIVTGTGSNLTILDKASVILIYDNNATRWQVVGGSGGGTVTLYGSTGSPRSVVSATGITSGASHMSTSVSDQVIFVVASTAGENDISANPQIEAGTVVGQKMTIVGTSDDDFIKLEDGTGLSLAGPWYSYDKKSLDVWWNGTVWTERSRRD